MALDCLESTMKHSGVENIDQDTLLRVTEWVFKHLYDHAQEGGSFRYLIYDRLGFGSAAYVPLYAAGGMTISDEFDLERIEKIKSVVREHKIVQLKSVLNMCTVEDCYQEATSYAPLIGARCSDHYNV